MSKDKFLIPTTLDYVHDCQNVPVFHNDDSHCLGNENIDCQDDIVYLDVHSEDIDLDFENYYQTGFHLCYNSENDGGIASKEEVNELLVYIEVH